MILYDFSKESKIIRFFEFKVVDLLIFEKLAPKIDYNTHQPLFIILFFVFKVDFDLFFRIIDFLLFNSYQFVSSIENNTRQSVVELSFNAKN